MQNPAHYSSARDLAVLGRAIYLTFPQYAGLFDIGAIRVGDQVIRNHNNMLGRYPGVDGMKTGFTCSAGFNLVASATRGNRHYIAVVLGAPTRRRALCVQRFCSIAPSPASTIRSRSEAEARRAAARRKTCTIPPAGGADMAVAVFQAETDRLEEPLQALSQRPQCAARDSSAHRRWRRETPVALRIAMMPEPAFDPEPVAIGPRRGL